MVNWPPATHGDLREAVGLLRSTVDIRDHGAKVDGKRVHTAGMTSGSAVLTASGAGFTAGDVGKRVVVHGAAASGGVLTGTITAYTSATEVTLSVAASTTVTNRVADWGTDDTSAVSAAFTAAGNLAGSSMVSARSGATVPVGATVLFPTGTALVTTGFVVPGGVNVDSLPGAFLRAAAPIAGVMIDTSVTVWRQGEHWRLPFVDGNALADQCIYFRFFNNLWIHDLRFGGSLVKGITLGDPAASQNSYNAGLTNLFIERPNGWKVPANSIGIHLLNATDSYVYPGQVNGYDIGVKTETGGNAFYGVHPWNYGTVNGATDLTNNPTYCFQEVPWGSGNAYVACIADTAKNTGFHMAGQTARLIAPKIYNSTFTGGDNVMTGIHVATPNAVTHISGLMTEGGDATHRIVADVTGDLTETTIIGSYSFNTGTQAATVIHGLPASIPPDVNEPFLGANNAAPDAARWSTAIGSGTGAAIVIDSNRLRLTTGSTGGYSGNDRVSARTTLPVVSDADLLFDLEYGNVANEWYFLAGVRSSDINPSANNSYALMIGSAGTVGLYRYLAGAQTSLHYLSGLGFTTGQRHWYRLRVKGSAVSWTYWLDGTAEPPPMWAGTDTAVTAPGYAAAFSLSGGSAAASGSVYLHRAILTTL